MRIQETPELTIHQPQYPEVEVRPAVRSELSAVCRLVSAAYAEFEPYLSPLNWARMTANIIRVIESGASGQLLVAHLAGRLAGTVTYLPSGPKDYRRVPQDWAVIRVLGVDPALRGHGVARALTEECLARARAERAPAVGLHTAEMMTAARALYEGIGFVRQDDFTHLDIRFCIYIYRLKT
ncbi:MAG: GNAT family N-acetyltransferase [Pseudonocardiaceae bacterium]